METQIRDVVTGEEEGERLRREEASGEAVVISEAGAPADKAKDAG